MNQILIFYCEELENQLLKQRQFKKILTESISENRFEESILNNKDLFNNFNQLFVDSINHIGILKTTNILARYGLKEENYIHKIEISSIQIAQRIFLKRFITAFIRGSCLETFKKIHKSEYNQIQKLKVISEYEIEQLELLSAVKQLEGFLKVKEQAKYWNHKLSAEQKDKIIEFKFNNVLIFPKERLEILDKYGYFKRYEIPEKEQVSKEHKIIKEIIQKKSA